MAGRISDADKERVRDASRIEQVVGEYVALRNAGGGNLKGLCPFHDEKTPSFQVSPARGYYHCFGCGEGGDVFAFLSKIEHLSFVETLQRLAERANITLAVVEGGTSTRSDRGTKPRLLAANKAAAEFYAAQLLTDGATIAQDFLAERGFDLAAAAHFGCGYAPDGWDLLVKALTAQGFSLDELYRAGLARQGQRGPIDQFHRRLLWAIRDAAGDVVGFGARRLFDDDRLEAKYVNTSETMLYKKSQMLFGLDLAKRDISRKRQVVVVEGYTDVMAMHLAGVTTAVASCGTAFGDEHISVLRRYLGDTQTAFGAELPRGEVVYTFDGDSAGKKAALKAFDSDQRFAANTFVAIAPEGMDPCELRQAKGDEALRALIDSRRNLFDFALQSLTDQYNLDTPEGQYAALTAGVPLVAGIKESTLRDRFAVKLAGFVGTDIDPIISRVRKEAVKAARQSMASHRGTAGTESAAGSREVKPNVTREPAGPRGVAGDAPGRRGVGSADRRPSAQTSRRGNDHHEPPPEPPDDGQEPPDEPDASDLRVGSTSTLRRPDPKDRHLRAEREALKLVLQQPGMVARAYQGVHSKAFTEPAYAEIHRAVEAAGGPSVDQTGPVWVDAVREHLPVGVLRQLLTELAVDRPEWPSDTVNERYAGAILAALAERVALIQERSLHSALQRAEASGDSARVREVLSDLVTVANYRRALSERARDQA